MKKTFLKVIGLTFALALVLSVRCVDPGDTENPPLHGSNTVTQLHIS